MRTTHVLLCACLFTLTSAEAKDDAQFHPGHLMMKPSEMKYVDVPSLPPGAKMAVIEGNLKDAKPFTARVKLPANYAIPPHSHPAIEHLTVLTGTLNMGSGETPDKKKTTALSAGSFAVMEPGVNHYVWTDKEAVIQLHGVGPWGVKWVNPKDDPSKQ